MQIPLMIDTGMPIGQDWPEPIALAKVYPAARSGREVILSPKGDRSAFGEHNQ
ncbi:MULTISPECIES: hypothetical protein [Aerosakkonema]|uniref:hypothetical protein n=1 Tax=Aerosakkonema TaxID=1246629 RepID=UPI0035BB0399